MKMSQYEKNVKKTLEILVLGFILLMQNIISIFFYWICGCIYPRQHMIFNRIFDL